MAGSDPTAASDGSAWLGDPDVFHGEGAFWDAESGALRYVDMLAGDVVTLAAADSSRTHVSDVVAVIRRRRAGGFVAAVERGFVLLDRELRIERRIPVFEERGTRMNEGACDASGRLFCGSMAYDARRGGGRLYRLDPDLSVHVVREQVSIPNGLVWTDGGHTALHADTLAGEIRAYEYDPDDGTLGRSRPFVVTSDTAGAPDGIALDTDGGVWVAMWNGGQVRRYDAQGRLDHVIDLPVTNPTSCAFGGPDRTTLYVTTSRQGIEPGAEPLAGRVLATPVQATGAPVHAFGAPH